MSESTSNQNGSDVALEVAGQKLNLRNIKSLNAIATIVGMFVGLLVLYILFTHQQDAKEGYREFVVAIKEQTTAIRDGTAAQREQTCILKFDTQDRKNNAEFCKQVSGAPR